MLYGYVVQSVRDTNSSKDCAFGVSVSAKFRADPNKFVVKDGKYFLFLYDLEVDAQQLWLAATHEKLGTKADNNWQKLSKEQ
jgi:hypothetical protein